VEKDSYALALSRYIHLNPVRARLVFDPSKYTWCSYSVYIGIRKGWKWLEKGFILNQISSKEKTAQRGYERYVKEGLRQKIEHPLEKVVGSTVLGSDGFIEWVRARWIKKKEINRDVPALKWLSRQPDLSMILKETEKVFGCGAESKRVALYLSHQISGVSLCEIGEFFGGIGPSAVTQNTRRLEDRLGANRRLLEGIERLKKTLSE
jgi:hypothetical protein